MCSVDMEMEHWLKMVKLNLYLPNFLVDFQHVKHTAAHENCIKLILAYSFSLASHS